MSVILDQQQIRRVLYLNERGNICMEESISISAFSKIYQMLEDDESKDIYLKRLCYLISGDFRYIRELVTSHRPDLIPWNGKDPSWLAAKLPQNKNFLLYGAGMEAVRILPYVKNDHRFIGFCSRTKQKQRNGYLGYPVMSPEELLSRKDLSVVISTTKCRNDIMQILTDGDYPQDLIFDSPLYYADTVFDAEQYFSPDFMTFDNEEIFVDAGAFDLATSLNLRNHCPQVKVYAFEPDPECYKHCLERKESSKFETAAILPFGTWSKRDTLHFSATSDSASHISETDKGYCDVSVMPIDEAIVEGDKVTFIKMDVEGAELESLKGAERTIRRDKPKLAISIYHKPEDMWTIPLYIKELVPEYKLYIRHHSSGTGETVLYAVMPRKDQDGYVK